MTDSKSKIDDVIAFLILKKLMTPVTKTTAYKNGDVDIAGNAIKDNINISLLDRLVFKLKRMLGSKISQLNTFTYVQSMSDSLYKQMTVSGNVDNLVAIKRLKNDISKLEEKYGSDLDSLIKVLLYDEFREG